MNFEKNYIVMVFVKEYEGRKLYSIGLSKKNKEGGYDNGYMSARFRKDVELENKTRIKVKDSWLSFNTNEGKTFPFVFINDFEVLGTAKPKEEADPYKEFGDNIKTEVKEQVEIQESDLPF